MPVLGGRARSSPGDWWPGSLAYDELLSSKLRCKVIEEDAQGCYLASKHTLPHMHIMHGLAHAHTHVKTKIESHYFRKLEYIHINETSRTFILEHVLKRECQSSDSQRKGSI